MTIASDIENLRSRHLESIRAASTESGVEDARLAALGRKGEVTLLLRGLGRMDPEERRLAAPELNRLKNELAEAAARRKDEFADIALDEDQGDLPFRLIDRRRPDLYGDILQPNPNLQSISWRG